MRQLFCAARRAREEAGFTLVEVLAAALILSVGLVALFQMLIVADHTTANDHIRQAETSLAREVIEDTRTLAYTQLTPTQIPAAIQPLISGSTASGSTLTVTRLVNPGNPGSPANYTFNVSFTACSLDDPADGLGDHSLPPASGGSWCPDNPPSGTTDPTPDDYKRVSIVVTPTGAYSTPTVQQTALIYAKATHGPAVTCLSVDATCPGANQTYTSGSSVTFNVTTSTPAASIQWLVNGSPPTSSEIPSGAADPYTPSGTTSSFTWNLPMANATQTIDGTYTISARAYDANGNSGTKSSLQVTINEHDAIPPANVYAGWNAAINGVDVMWTPSVDQDVLYYVVYHQYGTNSPAVVSGCSQVTPQNGLTCTDLSAPSPGTEPTCTSTPGQSFTTPNKYWVVGVDTDPSTGNPRVSSQLSTQVDANLCNNPPSPPTNLAAGSLNPDGSMTLTWTAPASPQDPDPGDTIAYWRIYRWSGTQPAAPAGRYDLIPATDSSGAQVTSYSDTSADPGGTKQSYCVSAVDLNMDESPCSTAVTG